MHQQGFIVLLVLLLLLSVGSSPTTAQLSPSLTGAPATTPHDSRGNCASTFHQTKTTAVVPNPPIAPVEIARLRDTASHYLLECIFIVQAGFPVTSNRECASPPNQRLQLCSSPVALPVGRETWNCTDISQYLTSQFHRVTVGSRNGPTLKFRITWFSGLTSLECYPRSFSTTIVSLSVPAPGTEPAVSGVFAGVVCLIGIAGLIYGFYALWRVTKKFEHRDENSKNGSSSSSKNPTPQEQYKAALRALGAPEELTSFYDEDAAGGQQEGEKEDGGESNNIEDEEEDEEYYYSRRRRGQQREEIMMDDDDYDVDNNNNLHETSIASSSAVLDNNQVVTSTPAPVPWYQRVARNHNQTDNINQFQPIQSSPSLSSKRYRQQQQQAQVIYSDEEE